MGHCCQHLFSFIFIFSPLCQIGNSQTENTLSTNLPPSSNPTSKSMKPNLNSTYINGVNTKNKKKQDPPLWKWKGLKLTTDSEKAYSITDFIHENAPKIEDSVLGPGAGAGVGCGVGVGVGLVGGMGFGGSAWNHVRIAFGFGIGCGVGAGFGFGQGFGYGSSWEKLKSRVVKPGPGKRKRLVIQI